VDDEPNLELQIEKFTIQELQPQQVEKSEKGMDNASAFCFVHDFSQVTQHY
jgi:hypothetical protein